MSAIALKKFFDPLRAFAFLNICGDVCLLASGVSYDNYVRMAPPLLGVGASLIGLTGMNARVFGWPASRVAMFLVSIAGILFMVSGSNISGFEIAPRFGEMVGGGLIFTGAVLNLVKKPSVGALCFVMATISMAGASLEPWLNGGRFDVWMMLSFVCFLSSNILTKWIR